MSCLKFCILGAFFSVNLFSQTVKYGQIPLAFEQNQGQLDGEAKFFLRSENLNLFVTNSGAVLALHRGSVHAAVRLEVLGASANATAAGEAKLTAQSNYFHGSDPAKWFTGISQYEKVRISEIRRGIDLLCYANENRFEYDLVVKPGARPSDIRLRFAGSQKTALTADGDLRIETAAGDLIQHKPRIWQASGGERKIIAGRYEIARNGEVTVLVGPYDRARDLVIDPVVSYSTYLGGTIDQLAAAIAVDSSGNAYISGTTFSADFPTTIGAYSVSLAGSFDLFITKINSTGTGLVYSTYLGGASTDINRALAIDSAGNAYVTGLTYSGNFPVTSGAFQTTRKTTGFANADLFVAKLNPTGTGLVYSTYIAGSKAQDATAIQTDAGGNAYITGSTSSVDFPVTSGAYATALPGTQAVFVTKINPVGSGLTYSTYLGGSGADTANAIAVDTNQNVYVAGMAKSSNFPATPGAYETSSPNNGGDTGSAFIAKISADGATLAAATYFGAPAPTGYDTSASAIALDSTNHPYLTGSTRSLLLPTTSGAFSVSLPCLFCYEAHGFVAKFDPALTSLAYSTYLAGTKTDSGNAIAVDSNGNAYIAGRTSSSDFPLTSNALFGKKNPSSNQTAFLAQLNPSGSDLKFSTLLAGTGIETAVGVALDSNQGAYVIGHTSSLDYLVTPNAYQMAPGSGQQSNKVFVTKLNIASTTNCALAVSPSSYVAPIGGGSSSFSIQVPPGCPWVLYNSVNTIVINGPTHGIGNATVNFSLPSNATSISAFSAGIQVGSSTFSISQPAGSCSTPLISPAFAGIGPGGGSATLTVSSPAGCSFRSKASVPWITVSAGLTVNGSGDVVIAFDPNAFATRTATLLIGNVNVPVTQAGAGCTSSAPFVAGTGAAGGTGAITLNVSATDCSWNAYSLATWIHLGTTTGSGSAIVAITLAPNPGAIPRTGQIQIASQTLTLTQASGPIGTPPAYTISTVAGRLGSPGYSGDGGPATNAMLNSPVGLAYDAIGNLYIADFGNFRVRRVGPDGTISTFAGTGSPFDSGDGGPALGAGVPGPDRLAMGKQGELYIAVQSAFPNATVRKVSNGFISTVASGIRVSSLAVDAANNVYFGGPGYIQRINPGGTLSTIAGFSSNAAFGGDGGPPALAGLGIIEGIAFDNASNLYLADVVYQRIRRITGNVIDTVAGTGTGVFNGDGQATVSALQQPSGVASDGVGNIVIVDAGNYRVRRLSAGNLSTIAGGNSYSSTSQTGNGDGGPALSAGFGSLSSVAIDVSGNIAVSDIIGSVVRLLTPTYSFCSFTTSVSSAMVPQSGFSFGVTVATNTACAWNAFSSVNWITVESCTCNGSGLATLQVAANPTLLSRSGTVNIAGQITTVTQPGISMLPFVVSVSPNSGSAITQTFTATYSDTAGTTALNRRLFLVSSTLNGAGACFIQTDPSGIYLVNDAGSGLLGPIAGSSSFSNSQCTLNGTGTSVVNAGANSTVTLAITFAATFSGPKNIYLFAEDSAGNTGFQTLGTFTVPAPSIPVAVSVSPGSGSAFTQTFTAVYSNASGANYLKRRLFLINSSLNGAAACYVQADATGVYLVNDAGSGLVSPAATTGVTVNNNQCTLNGTGSGLVTSGTNSILTAVITFKAAFAGTKNLYLYTEDTFGNNTGFQTRGTFAVPFSAPTADSVTPAAASGTAQTFTAVYSDASGAGAFNRRLFLVNTVLSGAGACFVQADPTGIYVVNDAGSGILGPITTGTTLTNGQCTLNGTGTSVVNSGTTSTVTLSIAFKPTFAGPKNIYLYDEDMNGNNSGFMVRGTYTVASAIPTADSVMPNASTGTTQTFTAVYSDASGATALNRRLFLIASSLNGVGACFVQADPTGLYLLNDADNALLGPVTAGGFVTNNQCTLNGTGSSIDNSGTVSTVTLAIAFKPAFAGTKNIYLYADDKTGNNSGFQTSGTYSVTGTASVPVNTSVTPSSGSGTNQTFTVVYSDAAGNSLLYRRLFLINGTLNGTGACLIQIDPTGIYLANDPDSAITGPLFTNSSLTNSQCTVNGAGASVSYSANSTTVVLPVTFKPAFAGPKNLYMYVDDTSGNSSGWQAMGTFTTQ